MVWTKKRKRFAVGDAALLPRPNRPFGRSGFDEAGPYGDPC